MRFFNTEGPVRPDDHYAIPPLDRMDIDELLTLIRAERYFVLHAPRQTGKTSAFIALRDFPNSGEAGDFRCVDVNVEVGQVARDDTARGIRTILGSLAVHRESSTHKQIRRIQARAAPNVGRRHRGAERLRGVRAAARLGHPHVHLAETGEDLALGQAPVAHHPLAPVGELLVTERRQVLLELRSDRSLDQPPRPGPHKLREGVGNQRWRRQRNHSIVAHVQRAPLAETVVSSDSISAKTRRTSQPIRTPLSTIAPE